MQNIHGIKANDRTLERREYVDVGDPSAGFRPPPRRPLFDGILAVLICRQRWLQQLQGGKTASDQSKVKTVRRSPSAATEQQTAGISISEPNQQLRQTFQSESGSQLQVEKLPQRLKLKLAAVQDLLSRAELGLRLAAIGCRCPPGVGFRSLPQSATCKGVHVFLDCKGHIHSPHPSVSAGAAFDS